MLTALLVLALPARACEPVPLRPAIQQAREQIIEGMSADAVQTVRGAETALVCTTELLDVEALGRLFQVGSVAALNAGELELAERWLRTAARVAGAVPFDANLPEAQRRRHTDVMLAADLGPKGILSAACGARVDGFELMPSQTRTVVSGEHYVQTMGSSGKMQTAVVLVEPNQSLDLCPAPELKVAKKVDAWRVPVAVGSAGLAAAGIVVTGLVVGDLGAWAVGQDQALLDSDATLGNALLAVGFASIGIGVAGLGAAALVPADGGGLLVLSRPF